MFNSEEIFSIAFTNDKSLNENRHSPFGGDGGG